MAYDKLELRALAQHPQNTGRLSAADRPGRRAAQAGGLQNIPKRTPEQLVQDAKETLTRAEENLAAHEAAQAFEDRCRHDKDLALTTFDLLDEAYLLHTGNACTGAQMRFAIYRKELQPLAESYGVKIVLVGDKSQATLVLL